MCTYHNWYWRYKAAEYDVLFIWLDLFIMFFMIHGSTLMAGKSYTTCARKILYTLPDMLYRTPDSRKNVFSVLTLF